MNRRDTVLAMLALGAAPSILLAQMRAVRIGAHRCAPMHSARAKTRSYCRAPSSDLRNWATSKAATLS